MRFHVGFSFRPKQLLKWLIPILIAFGLLSVSDFVKADSRTDLTYPSVNDKTICDRPLTDYISFFNYYIGDKYNLLVSYDSNDNLGNSPYFTFYFIPNLYLNNYLYTAYQLESGVSTSFYRLGEQNDFTNDFFYFQTFTYRIFENSNCDLVSFLDSPSAQNEFLSYVEDYSINKYNTSNHIVSGSNAQFLNSLNSHTYFVNGYAFLEFVQSEQFLYSNVNTIYKDEPPTWWAYYDPSEYSHYPTYINGSLLVNDQIIEPTYYPSVDFPVYGKEIGDLYLMVGKNDISSVSMTYSFNTLDSEYISINRPFLYRSYGFRHVSNNVYKLVPVTCSLGQWGFSYNSSNGNGLLTINGFTCSDIPSDVFQLTFVVIISNDTDVLQPVNDLQLSLSGNYQTYYFNKDNLQLGGVSFMRWNNLNREFKGFISTSNSTYTQALSVISSNNYTYLAYYNISPFTETNPTYNEYYKYQGGVLYGSYGLSINRGILLTNNYNISQDSTDLIVFLSEDSYFYMNDSTSDEVCYYDGSNVVCNNVVLTFNRPDESGDYDVDYYFSEVSDYIDSISSDMARFGQLVQSVYDSMPSFLSTFFFVIFILGNVFILLKLIKR